MGLGSRRGLCLSVAWGWDAEGWALGCSGSLARPCFPPEHFSSLAAAAVDLSSHFSWLLGMTHAALHGKLRHPLQKYPGRSAFLLPGSAQGLSWDRLLTELLRDAERGQVWGLPDDPPANKGELSRSNSQMWVCGKGICAMYLPALKLLLFTPCDGRCSTAGYVNQQQQLLPRRGNPWLLMPAPQGKAAFSNFPPPLWAPQP